MVTIIERKKNDADNNASNGNIRRNLTNLRFLAISHIGECAAEKSYRDEEKVKHLYSLFGVHVEMPPSVFESQFFKLDATSIIRIDNVSKIVSFPLGHHTPFTFSLSLNFCNFPVLVFGISANTMVRGHL